MDAPHNRTQCQIHDCKPNTIDGALPDGHRTDSKEYVETALRVRAFMGRVHFNPVTVPATARMDGR